MSTTFLRIDSAGSFPFPATSGSISGRLGIEIDGQIGAIAGSDPIDTDFGTIIPFTAAAGAIAGRALFTDAKTPSIVNYPASIDGTIDDAIDGEIDSGIIFFIDGIKSIDIAGIAKSGIGSIISDIIAGKIDRPINRIGDIAGPIGGPNGSTIFARRISIRISTNPSAVKLGKQDWSGAPAADAPARRITAA